MSDGRNWCYYDLNYFYDKHTKLTIVMIRCARNFPLLLNHSLFDWWYNFLRSKIFFSPCVCSSMDIISISPCTKRILETGKEKPDCHISGVSRSELQNFLTVSSIFQWNQFINLPVAQLFRMRIPQVLFQFFLFFFN